MTPPPDQRGGRLRLLALMIGVVIGFGALMVRLYDLQVNHGQTFLSQASRISTVQRSLPALRGLIYDRNGEPLVLNAPAYQVAIIPVNQVRYIDDPVRQRVERVEMYNRLATLIGQPAVTAGDIQEKVTSRDALFQPYRPTVIAENLSRETALTIQEQSLGMPGVVVQLVASRVYPHGSLFGNLLGYTYKIPSLSLEDQQRSEGVSRDWYDERIYARDDRVGTSGVEYVAERELRGVKGSETVRRDASGEELGTVGEPIPPKTGDSVRLTLDLRLQRIISDAMLTSMAELTAKGKSVRGAAIALDPNTGEVLGMLTTPGYDNNLFAQGISLDAFRVYSDNVHLPLLNHATRDRVPPGSTFKIVTAAALLEEKAVTPQTVINDPGVFVLPNQFFPDDPARGTRFYCWIGLRGQQHGPQRVSDALRNSCNTYFRKAVGGFAQEGIDGMGPEPLAKWALAFGIGDPQNQIETGGETGFVGTPTWKRTTLGELWTTGNSYDLGIGQGYVSTTPLEMANVMAVIANGGTLYQPRVIREYVDANGSVVKPFEPKVLRKLPITPSNMRLIQDSLVSVVSPSGTAVASLIPGFEYAGKTGTAEFCDDVSVKLDICYTGIRTLPTHAWFVAYAPARDPKIALAVYVWNGGQGSGVAAPIAQRIIADYFNIPLDKKAPVIVTE